MIMEDLNQTMDYFTMGSNMSGSDFTPGEMEPDTSTTPNITTTGSPEENKLFMFILSQIVTPVMYGLVTLIGTVGNILVIYVILSKKKMRTVTNILLLNLAMADLSFVLICPSFTSYDMAAPSWQFGEVACKLFHYLLNVTCYVTVYTLVLISVIRYMTIVYSTQTIRFRTKSNTVLMIIGIWFVMLAVNIPIILSHGVVSQEDYKPMTYDDTNKTPSCYNYGPQVGRPLYATFFIFAYLLPLTVIALLSMAILHHINKQKPSMMDKKSRSEDRKRQASRLIILVVVIFAILWLPIHIHLLIAYYGVLPQTNFYLAISVLWNVLAYFNSCVNPIIYNYASKEFRDSFRDIICCVRHTRQSRDTAVVTRTTFAEANGGEMKRLVSTVKGDEPADSAEV